MLKINGAAVGIRIALGMLVLVGLTGCIGVVDGRGHGAVFVPGPEVTFYGGGYEHGHEDRDYGRRGGESRGRH